MHIQLVIFVTNPRSPHQPLVSLTTISTPHSSGCYKWGWDGWKCAVRRGCSQGPAHRWTVVSSWGEIFFFSWAFPAGYSPAGGLVGFGTFSCATALDHPTAPGQRGGWGMPATSRTTGPHELVCRHSTAFMGEKMLPVRFPACQLVPGESKGLFLGNIDIKAEKN